MFQVNRYVESMKSRPVHAITVSFKAQCDNYMTANTQARVWQLNLSSTSSAKHMLFHQIAISI